MRDRRGILPSALAPPRLLVEGPLGRFLTVLLHRDSVSPWIPSPIRSTRMTPSAEGAEGLFDHSAWA
ncbi:MAG: hypothetical protein KatS3mg125_1815 [Lysobacterales bacterium]|nr:MAG: hypothetical protein KatS3mg125_1815 [Xanthomonadales bacterium]